MATALNQNGTRAGEPLYLADILVPERNSFAALRLALAVAVVASHSFWLVAGTSAAEPLVALTGHTLGEHAVQVFFFLSGLLAAGSLLRRRDVAGFAAGRALRILPALIVCVLATALALGPWLSTYPASIYYGDPKLIAYIAKTSAMMTGSAPLPGLFAFLPVPAVVNAPLATLAYAALCYGGIAALAVAGLFDARRRWFAAAALVLAVAVLAIDRPALDSPLDGVDGLRHFALFFGIGVLAGVAGRYVEILPGLLLPLGSLFFVALGTRYADLATALFHGYGAIVAGSLDLGWLRRVTNGTDLSYGIFIYACPIQQAMLQLYPGTPALPLTLAALAVVVPIAGLSWSLLEKPALGLRRRVSPAASSAAAASTVAVERALRAANCNAAELPALPRQHVMGPISARLAALREADRAAAATLPRLPRRDWRYARRRTPQTRSNRLMADVARYAPSRRARIRARHRPIYMQEEVVVRFRPQLV